MVQTILVLYMSHGFHFSDTKAYLVYGAFSSMLYLTPVLGGYIADRFIGFRQSIILGGILFIIGYAIMSIPSKQWLFLGLSIVILGNGFFKPNVSSIVGDLYSADDPRRDGGFTLFYMGINIGAMLPPIFAGALVSSYSYGSGFMVAAVGMIVSIITFLGAKGRLGEAGLMPINSPVLKSRAIRVSFYLTLFIGILALIGLLHILLYHPAETNLILIFASMGIIAAVLFYLYKESAEQKRKMTACLILILISVGFWSIYMQTFTSLMLFADRNMTKEIFGIPIDAEFTQFFNPFFIVILSPILSVLWVRLDEKKMNPSTPLKFGFGILLMAIGFISLSSGTSTFHENGLASPWWLILSYFLQTIGELLISPIGLAMVTRLSPRHLTGMMMGVWFLTTAAAAAIGGGLATLSDVPKDVTGVASLQIYAHAFLIYGGIAASLAVVAFILTPFLNRLIGTTNGPIPTPKR